MIDHLELPDGRRLPYPIFFPVHHRRQMVSQESLDRAPGMISNAFFFYKDGEIRRQVAEGLRLRTLVPHEGVLMTDSGAFQGFNRPLHLSNRKIVAFQLQIGSDIVSPLDLVTGPWERRSVAEKKLASTQKRTLEAFALGDGRIIAGVQQGGRFLDLRQRALGDLLDAGARYIALGSLVPFLTRNHDIRLVIDIVRQAREMVGEGFPLHLYGAGDPVELPFFAMAGANVFDSSSFAHFALADWYMTPFGAVRTDEIDRVEWRCPCAACAEVEGDGRAWTDLDLCEHNFATVLGAIDAIREGQRTGTLPALLDRTLRHHALMFPSSGLMASAAGL